MQIQCFRSSIELLIVLVVAYLVPVQVRAHCDSLDGPVVQDARLALETGKTTPVLKWVKKEYENEIRDVLKLTLAVRTRGNDAKALADRYFFETLVRLHRAGEGEAFTGLKPAGSVDPGIDAADKALRSGSAEELAKHMAAAVNEGIQKRFDIALERKQHAADSVDSGREYVDAYIDYIHFVENIKRLVLHGIVHKHHEPPVPE